jgi:DNA-damage-inducible protein D
MNEDLSVPKNNPSQELTGLEKVAFFQDKKIRKVWHEEEWWFSVVDIAEALTDSTVPKRYWSDLKIKLEQEGNQPYDFIVQLKLIADDSKLRETDCTNTEGAFRIIQSIHSPKAEPFKLWLAKTGYERIQEIENPELAQDRARKYYELKGYSQDWIEKRVRGITIRQDLTKEWKDRKVGQEKEYAILTNEISKATFGKTVGEYKKFKGLKKANQNLRDHMNDLVLIFNMLGERVTTEITKTKNSQGFVECKDSAQQGGSVAGNARKDAEKRIGKPLVLSENFLKEPEKSQKKRLE